MTLASSEMDTPAPVSSVPELAKMPAVTRLTTALTSRGLEPGTAQAISVSVCDPSAVRRQLEQPSTLRVNGGALEVVYADVWVPAVLPYPENPRMLPGLSYAVEGETGRRRPLPPARPGSNPLSPELVLEPGTSANLVAHLDAQMRFLRDNNDLATSVGNYGIHEPLLVVPLALKNMAVGNEVPSPDDAWPTILTSVDGNSRLAAAYGHLRLDPGDVVTRLLGNPRATRQTVGNTLSLFDDGEMSADEEAALRVIVAPAAIIIGFKSDRVDRNLMDAIQSRLGALHVAPPKPWSPASKYDLLLNVSLEALQPDFDNLASGYGFSGDQYREWLAGIMGEKEAKEVGLDTEVDLRAASLRWWFRKRDRDISAAIRGLDLSGSVSPAMRANIAAEGALRSFRSEMGATEADNARRVLAALYQLDDIGEDWEPDDLNGLGSVSAAVRAAMTELAATDRPGPNGRLLMVMAFYWLARYRILPLQTRGGMKDRRKMVDVVKLMCRSEHGMRLLGQAITDGRNGVHPRAISADGKLETSHGKQINLTDGWIRETWAAGRTTGPEASPERDLENRTANLADKVRELKNELSGLTEPKASNGRALVEINGLELAVADDVLAELSAIRDRIIELRIVSRQAIATEPASPDDDDEFDL